MRALSGSCQRMTRATSNFNCWACVSGVTGGRGKVSRAAASRNSTAALTVSTRNQ